MSRPSSRPELLERMGAEFDELLSAVDEIESDRRLGPSDYPRGSVKDMLAHLDAWHRMFLEWERVGRTGEVAEMPAPGHTWKTTPALSMEIHERHKATTSHYDWAMKHLRRSRKAWAAEDG